MLDVRCSTFIRFLIDQTGRSRPQAPLMYNFIERNNLDRLSSSHQKNYSQESLLLGNILDRSQQAGDVIFLDVFIAKNGVQTHVGGVLSGRR